MADYVGTDGNDSFVGTDADELIQGGNGGDTLNGGGGDDTLIGGLHNDRLIGGDGIDTVSYGGATVGVQANLSIEFMQSFDDSDALVGIENIIGSDYNDTLTGDDGDNILRGGQGHDNLDGGAGFDTVSFADATSGVWLHLGSPSQTSMGGGLGSDTLYNIEAVIGSDYDDDISTGQGDFVIDAGAGDDWITVQSAPGADLQLTLGAGQDTIYFFTQTLGGAVVTDFEAGAGGDLVHADTLLRYETNWDRVTNPFASGHLRLLQDGADTLLQVDTDGGGDGFVTALYLENTDWLAFSSENFDGGYALEATFVGDATDEVFEIGPAIGHSVTIDGGDGVDELRLSLPTRSWQHYSQFTVSGDGTSILVDLDDDGDTDLTITNVETLSILGGQARLVGDFSGTGLASGGLSYDGNADPYNGLDASGMIGQGAIVAYGRLGNDELIGAEGDDWLEAGRDGGGSDWLEGGAGDDTLTGGSGNNFIEGGAGNDVLMLPGTAADYVFNTGANGWDGIRARTFDPDLSGMYAFRDVERLQFTDQVTDALGNTLYLINPPPPPEPEAPQPPPGPTPGDDRLNLDGTQLLFDAGEGADYVTGGEGANTILGGEGDDSLFGGAGDDVLDGGVGSNYLRGGEGQDSLTGGEAFDDLHGGLGDDSAHGGEGGDWVVGGQGQDVLFGDTGGDVVLGNLGQDVLDGGVGNDVVRGGQGDDSVLGGEGDDWLAGDRGSDTLLGGAGADVFHSWGQAGADRVADFDFTEGDRINLLAGTSYTVAQVGADTVITMSGGGELTLAGVQLSGLAEGWITVG